MSYTHVLLDLDHTLLDTESSLVRAFDDAMAAAGTETAEHYATFSTINQALWRRVEAHELTPPQVHVTRFVELCDRLHLDADPQRMADAFALGMGRHGELYDGARDVLDALDSIATLGLVTNGLSDIQRARIERLDLATYFDAITISAEVGCAKPGTEIFDLTFEALDVTSEDAVLMVGDSLSSDIAGGNAAGIDTCWYNAAAAEANEHRPTHTIADLASLVPIVRDSRSID